MKKTIISILVGVGLYLCCVVSFAFGWAYGEERIMDNYVPLPKSTVADLELNDDTCEYLTIAEDGEYCFFKVTRTK